MDGRWSPDAVVGERRAGVVMFTTDIEPVL